VNESLGTAGIAYERIRQAIVEGELRAGQRLIEQRIAAEFGLSRTPVREALRRLESEGLVRIELNRGAVVRAVSGQDVEDLYELRAHLESLAAERAAQRATPQQLAALNDAVEQFDAAVNRATSRANATHGSPDRHLESLREVSRTNQLVHGLIVDAAAHERLADLLHRTVDVPLVFAAFAQFDAAGLIRSGLFHRMIVAAITAGEAPRAGALMKEHIYQGRDQLLAGLVGESTTSQSAAINS
jgi:DNA-binding GntR family transcriptional regulator